MEENNNEGEVNEGTETEGSVEAEGTTEEAAAE